MGERKLCMISKLNKHQDAIPYTMMCRETVQFITNPSSLAIWVYLQSKPDNWVVRKTDIKKHFSMGDISYGKAIRYLKDIGIYRVVNIRDERGRIIGNEIFVSPFSQGLNGKDIMTEVVETPQLGKPDIREISTLKENRSIKEEKIYKEQDTLGFHLDLEEFNLFQEYIEMRKAKRMITTDAVKKRLLTKYFKYGRNLEIIEKAITSNWKDFYELKADNNETYKQHNQFTKNQKLQQANSDAIEYLKQL